jgi:hypothetical protein
MGISCTEHIEVEGRKTLDLWLIEYRYGTSFSFSSRFGKMSIEPHFSHLSIVLQVGEFIVYDTIASVH